MISDAYTVRRREYENLVDVYKDKLNTGLSKSAVEKKFKYYLQESK